MTAFKLERTHYVHPRKPKRKDTPAVLLRVERKEIHGQMVDVEIWSAGPHPKGAQQLPSEKIKENYAAARAEAKGDFTPFNELCNVGLPGNKAVEFMSPAHAEGQRRRQEGPANNEAWNMLGLSRSGAT